MIEIGCGPGAAAREVARRVGPDGHVLAVDRSTKAIRQLDSSASDPIASGVLSVRDVACEDLEREPGEARYDPAFAVRVGALDGRHPDAGTRALERLAHAVVPSRSGMPRLVLTPTDSGGYRWPALNAGSGVAVEGTSGISITGSNIGGMDLSALEHWQAVDPDLKTAFRLADVADKVTLRWWSPDGVASQAKVDGTPVTEADVSAEKAVLAAVREFCPGDGFLGEEIGERLGTTGRRWIVDGIDGTRFFARGQPTWGTLIALECDGGIAVGVSSSPAQDRRWWASRGSGAFTGRSTSRSAATRIHVSRQRELDPDRVVALPTHSALAAHHQQVLERLANGRPSDPPWSHQNRVAEGAVDLCVWFCGDIWDHAAPSIIVEEAGGRFSDHQGSRRLDSRTAVYSNGKRHNEVVAALAQG